MGGKHYTKDNFQQSVMNYVANFAALEVDHRLAHILNLVKLTKQGQPFILGMLSCVIHNTVYYSFSGQARTSTEF